MAITLNPMTVDPSLRLSQMTKAARAQRRTDRRRRSSGSVRRTRTSPNRSPTPSLKTVNQLKRPKAAQHPQQQGLPVTATTRPSQQPPSAPPVRLAQAAIPSRPEGVGRRPLVRAMARQRSLLLPMLRPRMKRPESARQRRARHRPSQSRVLRRQQNRPPRGQRPTPRPRRSALPRLWLLLPYRGHLPAPLSTATTIRR